jgi:hypothetical protein
MKIENIMTFLAEAKISATDAGVPVLTASQVLANTLNLVYFVAGAFAVIIIILSGYTYATALYDSAKIAQAKNAILYASVGLFIVAVAFVMTQFIIGSFKI